MSPPASPGEAPIDFWFDFASPYGYFMSWRIDAIAARHGRRVRWRPVILFAVLRALGLPPPMGHEAKRTYMQHDFERSARFLGVPFRRPEAFPAATHHAARAFYLLERSDPRTAMAFARTAMRAYFTEGADLGDPMQIAQWAREANPQLGEAAGFAARLRADEARALLASAVEEAVRAQVFGSPMIVIDGERFFGVDRLPQIEGHLEGNL